LEYLKIYKKLLNDWFTERMIGGTSDLSLN